MPNATVPAIARAMPKTTNRRGALCAVLAGAVIGAVPAAAIAANELTEADRRAIERLARYRAMNARLVDLNFRADALEDKLPDIGQSEKELGSAHEKRRHKIWREEPGGYDASMLRACREIEQAYLDGRLVDEPGLVNGANYWRQRIMSFQEDDPKILAAIAAFDENDRQLEVDLAACKAREAAHEAERERLGLDSLEEEHGRLCDDLSDLRDEILSSELRSPHALAAAVMIKIDDTDEETADILRASLASIRPQLVGAIAEDADRVLAQNEEAA
jgi:hypothetical protein